MIDPLIGVRAVHLAATAVAAGVTFFALIIARPVQSEGKLATRYFATLNAWVALTLAVAVASGLAWAWLVARQLDATPRDVLTDGTLATLLTQTRFGDVWMVRGALAVVMALTFLRPLPWLRLLAAALMLASLACVGHSGARADWVGWFQLGADMAHLLAAGLWLGSLPALALLLSRGAPDEAAAATRRFSGFGIVAVATLLGTGAFNTYLLTDSITDLIETDYGRLLLLKLGLFATMVAFAAFNRLYWTPRLPGAGAANAIRRHSLVEAALGLGVITIVGALGTLPPPLHRHVHPTEPPSDAAFVHIHDVRAMTDVTVTPGRPGANEISLNLMQEDFTPQPAEAVSVELLQPGQSSVAAQARTIAPGRWNASAVLPSGGVWTVVVTIRTGAGPPIVLDGPIVLGPGSPAKSANSE